MKLCDYGCNQPALYKFKNGKVCCSESLNKCFAMRNKNSLGNIGKTKHTFKKLDSNDDGILCYYGCGIKAIYMSGQINLKPCCSKYYLQCPAVIKKISLSNTGNIRPRGNKSKLFGRKRPDQSKFMKKNNPMFHEKAIKTHKKVMSSKKYKKNMSVIVKTRWEDENYRLRYEQSIIKKGLKRLDDELEEIERYRRKVKAYTKKSVIKFFDKINPNNYAIGVGNGFYNIDHIYSIIDGFKNNIDPKIIGSYVNLQTIPSIENIKKNDKSWISKKELIRRYNENENSF